MRLTPARDKPAPEGHVLEHREMRKQVELLKHHADVAPHPFEQSRGVRARLHAVLADRHRTGVEGLEAVQAAQERALAASRRTDDRRHLALAGSQADVGEHARAAAGLR